MIIVLAAGLALAGCGGGGSTPPSATRVVVKGRVAERNNQSVGVEGAIITIAGYSGRSDSNGNFRIELPNNVVDPTFSITPPEGYSSNGVFYNSQYICPQALPTPLPLRTDVENDFGLILCFDANPPPPPADCP